MDNIQGDTPSQTKVPSPNDAEHASISQKSQVGTGNVPNIGGLNNGQRTQGVQQSSVRTDTDITSIAEQSQGNTTVRITQSGSNASSYQTNTSSHSGNNQTVNGSHNAEKTEIIQQSSVQINADTIAQTEIISGVNAIREESSSTPTKLRSSTYSISNKSDIEVIRNHVTRKNENSSPSSFSSKNDCLSNADKQFS